MSAQDEVRVAPEYSNTREITADTRHRITTWLVGRAALPALWVTLFTLMGLAARLYRLDARGFWWDEITFAYSARLNSPADVLFLAGRLSD